MLRAACLDGDRAAEDLRERGLSGRSGGSLAEEPLDDLERGAVALMPARRGDAAGETQSSALVVVDDVTAGERPERFGESSARITDNASAQPSAQIVE
ncbi:MAG: hypothetical protein QM783_05700 [Phycisphaerales bacterium]